MSIQLTTSPFLDELIFGSAMLIAGYCIGRAHEIAVYLEKLQAFDARVKANAEEAKRLQEEYELLREVVAEHVAVCPMEKRS